ncbi:MAG: hypothetical protein ASARMPREDX12_001991 [Alectoria sarmentosa]|nr:MAG: hypothetical protein ASARMPREDX12_001991 [Alectoria sarmentosa]
MVGRSLAKGKRAQARLGRKERSDSKDDPTPAAVAIHEPVTPLSESSSTSHTSTIPSWSLGPLMASNTGLVTPLPEESTSSLAPTTPSWPGNLNHLLDHIEASNELAYPNMTSSNVLSERNSDDYTNNLQVIDPGRDPLNADLNFDQYSIPDIFTPVQDTSNSTASVFGGSDFLDYPPTSFHIPSSTQPHKATQLHEASDPPSLPGSFPHISALGKIIGHLEGHIQNKAIGVDEVMRINKTCMTGITEIMNSEVFKSCKSCRMLILTAMDLVITLYEIGVSEDSRSTLQSSQPQSIDRSRTKQASLLFGVFQLEPDDHVMLRNQIVRIELERCIQVIQIQSTELRDSSSDKSMPSHKIHQQWFSVIENRARVLASSLKSMDVSI